MENLRKFEKLVEIIEILRAPGGCPWDREQTIEKLKPYLIEETYEVLEAMDEGGEKLAEELGDLLLQVVFQSQIKKESNEFDIGDVIESINKKLIRRHPHVFGNVDVKNSDEVMKNWEEIKKKEKGHEQRKSQLDGIPKHLPSIMKAHKIQKKASKVGFDWDNPEGAINKMEEELEEFREAYKNKNIENMKEELGDIMFSLINVARMNGIDPEEALNLTIKKFDNRFRYIESKLDLKNASINEMEKYWEEAKNETR